MNKTISQPARRSWITHFIAWSSLPDLFAVEVSGKDPVTLGVWKTHLQHLGIDKTIYVREVRPNL